jgi:CheY-like chemotaxis protein
MLNVLIVDDEPLLLKVMERLLTRRGYIVQTAVNVPEALKLARQRTPDILVTDYNLNAPQNGLDLCRAFAEDATLVKVRRIVISGQANNLKGLGILYDAFLAKPFTSSEFVQVLERFITGSATDPDLLARSCNSGR